MLTHPEQISTRYLEIGLILGVVGAEHLRGAKRRAVAREHIGNLALADGDEIRFVDSVHEREKQMEAAAQHFGLVACLTVQRDESLLDRTSGGPEFFDDSDLVVGDIAKDIGNAQQDDDDCDHRCGPKSRLDKAKAI